MIEHPGEHDEPVMLPIRLRDEGPFEPDAGDVILTCANCGAPMDERKCKLICC